MRKSVLILGATGRFGRHATEAFWNAGWHIRPFDRALDDLDSAASESDVIIAAWNPLYPEWEAQVPALHARIQKAAHASDATVILPGNVYVYGADTPAPWGVGTPHVATNPLGVVRARMEESYRNSGVKTIILRAGDFIDTEASGNWLDKVMLPRLSKGQFTYPGHANVAHSWAYLPDLAQAAVALAEMRNELDRFTDVPFAGYTLTGNDMAQALSGIAGRPIRVKPFAWWILQAAKPVWPMARCLSEMRYLWDVPHHLDGSLFRTLCPQFRDTPLEVALGNAAAPFLRRTEKCTPRHWIKRSTQTIR